MVIKDIRVGCTAHKPKRRELFAKYIWDISANSLIVLTGKNIYIFTFKNVETSNFSNLHS